MAKRITKDIWDRSKDGSHKEQRSFIRYAIITSILLVIFLLVKKDSIIRWAQTGFTISKQHKQMEYYNKEIKRLDEQIKLLSNDKDSLETYAREQFHFAEPGDDVYLIEE